MSANHCMNACDFDTVVLNVQGLTQTKCDVISAELDRTGVKLLLLTETWCLREAVSSYTFQRWVNVSSYCRQNHIRGGVGIWVDRGIDAQPLDLEDFCTEMDVEVCGVRYENYFIICCYRSPSGNLNLFLNKLEEILSLYYSGGRCRLVLAGDLNVDLLVESRDRQKLEFVLSAYGLRQHVRKPTRVEKWSLLDHLYTNFEISENATDVLERNAILSDHSAVMGCILGGDAVEGPSYVLARSFSQQNVSRFYELLSVENWLPVYQKGSSCEQFNTFLDIFLNYFDICFPSKKLSSRNVQNPG